MSQIASFYLIKNNQRQELSDGDCSGAVYMAIWDWCESELDLDVRFSCFPRRRIPWTALCWRENRRLNCWQLCGSRTFRSWPLKLPQTGICPPRRCKAGLIRCAPIWNWCRAMLLCCMK